MSRLSRRRLLTRSASGLFGVGAVALLAACGAGASSAVPATTSSSQAAASTAPSSSAASTSTASAARSTAAATSAAAGGKVQLHFYSSGDVNIQQLWNNDLLPIWNKQHPNAPIQLIFSEHGATDQAVIDKLAGAKAAGKPTDIDLFEGGNNLRTYGEKGIFVKLTTADVPDLSKTPPDVVAEIGSYGVPYRASSVVLAYNSAFVKDPPTTLDGVYAWVKANKGKFTYNPPDTGGSGGDFVQATLEKFIPKADLKTFETSYDPSLEKEWDPGFALLKSLGPYVLNGGFYPKGNVPVLQELGKQTVYVAPVWSDMGLSYLAQKLLPDTVKLEQITPPFSGGAAYLGVPTGSQHQDWSFKFLQWVLQPDQQTVIIDKINGYPGLEWKYMPGTVRQKFAALAKSYDTFSFSSKFSSDVNKLWYEKVAGTPSPAKQ
ncbi:MAG: extracellular solute-binding protein [Chloroflexi bacterium]|nr:extracellular solute-binding protein [Chloroflexota bacterium]